MLVVFRDETAVFAGWSSGSGGLAPCACCYSCNGSTYLDLRSESVGKLAVIAWACKPDHWSGLRQVSKSSKKKKLRTHVLKAVRLREKTRSVSYGSVQKLSWCRRCGGVGKKQKVRQAKLCGLQSYAKTGSCITSKQKEQAWWDCCSDCGDKSVAASTAGLTWQFVVAAAAQYQNGADGKGVLQEQAAWAMTYLKVLSTERLPAVVLTELPAV